MIEGIKHIFFDLDRTLWDFDANSAETFREIFDKYKVNEKVEVDFDTIYAEYQQINHDLWEEYRSGKITKDFLNIERFHKVLLLNGINDFDLAKSIAKNYIRISPTKKRLFPNTHQTLSYLTAKGYHLHIITNGFPEVQHIKLRESDLRKYFDQLIISEEVGFKKPSIEIFQIALTMAQATANESVMIGDDPLIDIKGAVEAGLQAVFVNHHQEPKCGFCDYEVASLMELEKLF